MISAFKRQWHAFRQGRPGQRFQAHYESSRRAPDRETTKGRVVRAMRIVAAAVAVAIGVILVFIPGPAVLFFFIAGGLLASGSRGVAWFCDWCELRLRAIWDWSRRRLWKRKRRAN